MDAPKDWRGIIKHLGPGLIITACIVGSGELIATPMVGAEQGATDAAGARDRDR